VSTTRPSGPDAPTQAEAKTRTPRPDRLRRRRTPPITVILLVRHGTTPTTGKVLPGRTAGLHLSEVGNAQAVAAAQRIGALKKLPVAIYSSPLERTRETAAPIAKAIGQRVRSERGLLEANMGTWTGQELRTLAKLPEWSTVQRWPSGFRFPDGESFLEMSSRIQQTLISLVAKHPGETVVAVSHADPIKAVLAGAAGMPLDHFQRLVVSPCSVSALAYGPDGTHVLCMNSTGSLSELGLS
jgi:probable phosphomutase (TIGR03848 family)